MFKRVDEIFDKYVLSAWYPYLWIAFTVIVLYFKTVTFSFVNFDDNTLILDNFAFISDMRNIFSAFGSSVYLNLDSAFYRPVLTLSFMLNALVGGKNPAAYHAVNIAIHALAAGLLFKFLLLFDCRRAAALFLAVVFAVHPALVSAVAWVPGRNDMLLGVFILASFLSLARYLSRPSPLWYTVHMAFFVTSLLTKENAVSLVVVGMLYAYFIRPKRPLPREMVNLFLGWAGIVGIWIIVRTFFVSGLKPFPFLEVFSLAFAKSLFQGTVMSFGYCLLPFHHALYPRVSAIGMAYGAGALILCAASVLYFRGPRNYRIIFGGIWFLAFLLPAFIDSNLYFFEHRMYVPLIGVLIIAAEVEKAILSSSRIFYILRRVSAAAIILLFAVNSYLYSDVFTAKAVYWQEAVKQNPQSAGARVRLSRVYIEYGMMLQAEYELNEAVRLDPLSVDAHVNFGYVYLGTGRPGKAEKEFKNTLNLDPKNADALKGIERCYAILKTPEHGTRNSSRN